eukprot:314734_1
MSVFQLKRQRAKHLFNTEQFTECKELLLEIIQESNADHKLLMQLGNICTELSDYKNAKIYYQQSISANANYSSVYCKFAILLSQYLNEYNLAIQMFEQCIKLNPKNDLCWFSYGKLMYKLGNFKKAKLCYLKCQSETAGLHYHFAKLLLTISNPYTNPDEIENAKLKLEKATKIKPNNGIYHYQYALCLKKLKQYYFASKQFKLALQHNNKLLVDTKIKILYDYSNLLSSQFNNY